MLNAEVKDGMTIHDGKEYVLREVLLRKYNSQDKGKSRILQEILYLK